MKFKITLEILTPVHIGTGDQYQAYEYLISDQTFYQFSLERFFESLPDEDKSHFEALIDQNNLLGIRRFVAERFQPEIANYQLPVSPQVARQYQERFDDLANQLLISPFIRNPLTYEAYVPGSSLKGAIRTGVINGIGERLLSKEKNPERLKEEVIRFSQYFELKFLNALHPRTGRGEIRKDPFRAIRVSDLKPGKASMLVGGIYNCPKSTTANQAPKPISIQMWNEVFLGKMNGQSSILSGELRFEDDLYRHKSAFGMSLNMTSILEDCQSFYRTELDREIEFYEENMEVLKILEGLRNEKLEANQTLLRLGRYSGVYAVTINQYRAPKPPGNKGWGKSRNLFEARFPLGWAKLTLS